MIPLAADRPDGLAHRDALASAPTALEFELEAFAADLRASNRSDATIGFYRAKVAPFLGWLAALGVRDPEAITPRHLRAYMNHLSHSHSAGGCHAYFRAVRAFLRFIVREGTVVANPLASVRAPRVDLEPLEPVDPETVLAMVETCDRGPVGLRDRSLLLALLDSDVRAGEAVRLNVADVDLRDGSVLVRRSKSRRHRTVFLGTAARRALAAYLRKRGDPAPDEPLWLAYHRTGEETRLT